MLRTAVILTFALGLCACASMPWSSPLTLAPCTIEGVKEALQCGTLAVREDHGDPESRTIALKVMIVPAAGEKTQPPLYSLEGGPGISATGTATFWAGDGAVHRANRDVVLVDQRGTGGSAPLNCGVKFADPLAPVLDTDLVRDCRERLSGHADLAQYTTAAAVEDLEGVRAALGHKQIDLIGLSYGTRLAQEYLRAYPQRVRAVAMLGTVSPREKLPLSFSLNAQVVLNQLAEQCSADTRCHKSINDLSADISALKSLFVAGYLGVTRKDGHRIRIEEGPFWEGVRKQLTTTASQRRLPWLLHQAAYGDLEPILAAMTAAPDPGSNGLLLSVSCSEDSQRITAEETAALSGTVFGSYRVRRQIAACKNWRVPALDNPRPGFVTGDVPVLLMAGSMDHVTPVDWAQQVASYLPNSRVVVIPKLGHFPDGLSNMECYDRVIAGFFTAGSAKDLDLTCVASMQPPPFDVPRAADKPARKVEKKKTVKKKAGKKKSLKKKRAKKKTKRPSP